MAEPKNYLSPQEKLKQHYKSQANKGAAAVRQGREQFTKDYVEPTAKFAGAFSPMGPVIGLTDAYNAYKKGDTTGAVIGAGLEALPYGLKYASKIPLPSNINIDELKKFYYQKAPWTWKPNPNNYYRAGNGIEFLNDVIQTNKVRAYNPNSYVNLREKGLVSGIRDTSTGKISLKAKTFPEADTYWSKGVPLDNKYGTQYYGDHIIEASDEIPFILSVNQRTKQFGFWDNPDINYNITHMKGQYVKPRQSYDYDKTGKITSSIGSPLKYDKSKITLLKPSLIFGYKKYSGGGNIDLYNRLNPAAGFLSWDIRKFFNLGPVLDNSILYTLGGGKPRKGTNLASPEEEAYWKLYNNIPQDIVKPTNVRINFDKGDTTSEFVGMPDTMLERIAAIADTTNTGKMLRNFDTYEERLAPINKLKLKEIYETGKRILNNPGKGQQVNEESTLKAAPNGKTGLGALQNFGVVWDKSAGKLRAYDTYDFPDYLSMFIPKREKPLKIRGEIKFDPLKGSKILNDKDYKAK